MKITCMACNTSLKVQDSLAGKRGKCPKCDSVIDIPPLPPEPTKTPGPPATERQKEYALSLGINFSPDITKEHISRLIDKAVEEKDNERFRKLDELADRESKAYEEMRTEILEEIDETDCRLSKATTSQIVEELGNRDRGAVLISFPIDDIDFENLTKAKFEVSFSDNLSETEMHVILMGLGSHAKRQLKAKIE